VHHWIVYLAETTAHAGGIVGFFAPVSAAAVNGVFGVVAGLIAVAAHTAWQKAFGKPKAAH
jgi:predicted DNA repair protein MutK